MGVWDCGMRPPRPLSSCSGVRLGFPNGGTERALCPTGQVEIGGRSWGDGETLLVPVGQGDLRMGLSGGDYAVVLTVYHQLTRPPKGAPLTTGRALVQVMGAGMKLVTLETVTVEAGGRGSGKEGGGRTDGPGGQCRHPQEDGRAKRGARNTTVRHNGGPGRAGAGKGGGRGRGGGTRGREGHRQEVPGDGGIP